MSNPILLAFCSPADRAHIRDASGSCPVAYWGDTLGTTRDIILLAIGPEGGAALARWVEAHGLEGVVGVGLVGVTAPWAETRYCFCGGPMGCVKGPKCIGEPLLPLGPLEPLRGVAERARRHTKRLWDITRIPMVKVAQLRFVIAAAPDDGVCQCLDMGGPRIPWDDCGMCDGTGKALSSAEVAYELTGINADGSPDSGLPPRIDRGGVTVRSYETLDALTEHGLRTVIERLTR